MPAPKSGAANQPDFLSATEYRLLLQFAHHVGKIMTRRRFADQRLGT
ncbi:MAG: helix-turn-helix domain-containing protein [Candidatus Moduliflexus flocculans]|nr:helix-turn-helix domain-containing protein [Candidatus Moduliflexus flocculans]